MRKEILFLHPSKWERLNQEERKKLEDRFIVATIRDEKLAEFASLLGIEVSAVWDKNFVFILPDPNTVEVLNKDKN